mgnify:FL=1
MIFVSTYDVCKGKAAHLRMTDSSANLNTYSYWEYVNSTSPGTRTFLMCDNPLSQVSLDLMFKGIILYTGLLVVSCFIWSCALDSYDVVLPPYSITSKAPHMTDILTSTLF